MGIELLASGDDAIFFNIGNMSISAMPRFGFTPRSKLTVGTVVLYGSFQMLDV